MSGIQINGRWVCQIGEARLLKGMLMQKKTGFLLIADISGYTPLYQKSFDEKQTYYWKQNSRFLG
jgi:hypothetical protein